MYSMYRLKVLTVLIKFDEQLQQSVHDKVQYTDCCCHIPISLDRQLFRKFIRFSYITFCPTNLKPVMTISTFSRYCTHIPHWQCETVQAMVVVVVVISHFNFLLYMLGKVSCYKIRMMKWYHCHCCISICVKVKP